MEDLMLSIAVRMPTKAVMPIAIIKIVRIVLRSWLVTERSAICIFSQSIFMAYEYTTIKCMVDISVNFDCEKMLNLWLKFLHLLIPKKQTLWI